MDATGSSHRRSPGCCAVPAADAAKGCRGGGGGGGGGETKTEAGQASQAKGNGRLTSQRDIARISVVTAATALPLVVATEVRTHLRIGHSAEDDALTQKLNSAIGELAAPIGWLGRSIMPQTLRLTLDGPPPRVIYLPGPPVTKIETIKTRGDDDTLTTIYDDGTSVDTIGLKTDLTAEPALIWPDDDIGWPSDIKQGPDSMRIDYDAGYADAASVPSEIKEWLLLRVGELYRDREASMLGIAGNPLHHAQYMLSNLRVRC